MSKILSLSVPPLFKNTESVKVDLPIDKTTESGRSLIEKIYDYCSKNSKNLLSRFYIKADGSLEKKATGFRGAWQRFRVRASKYLGYKTYKVREFLRSLEKVNQQLGDKLVQSGFISRFNHFTDFTSYLSQKKGDESKSADLCASYNCFDNLNVSFRSKSR